MGKKINPRIFRITTTVQPLSKWFASKRQFASYLQQDVQLRKMIRQKLRDSGVSRVEIRRSTNKINIVIHTSKPGVIIGRSGAGVDELKRTIKKQFFGSAKIQIQIEIEEIRTPDLDAQLVVQNVAYQLEKRVPFRRAMKRAIESVMAAGAKGVKVICAGRLNGVEISRTETLVEGSIPTHTMRAELDYSRGVAHTVYGQIGIKVWIYKGLIFGDETTDKETAEPERRQPRRRKVDKPAVRKSTHHKKRTIVKGGAHSAESKKAKENVSVE